MKYVIYARKSTEDREDRQILSIDSQIEEIKKRFPELNIVKIITESKSAYKANNRPEFERMLRMFEEGKADGLLSWHPDRLSREPYSAAQIITLLDQKRIKDLKFVTFNFDNSPEGKMMLALMLSQSKYSSEKLAVDVKRGMLKKCKLGQRPTLAPLGYINDKYGEKGEKKVLIDEERFALVRKLWDLFLTGQYSAAQLIKEADKWGLKARPSKRRPARELSKNGLYKILSNPFYAGYFEWAGEKYEGSHQPMISLNEYEHAQKILGVKGGSRPKHLDAPYSGMFRCECGMLMYTDSATKYIRSTQEIKRYFYLRCSSQKKGDKVKKCPNKAVSADLIDTQIKEFLSSIEISPVFEQWALKTVRRLHEGEANNRQAQMKALENSYSDCVRRIERLTDALISELITEEEYKLKKANLLEEKERLFKNKEQADQSVNRWLTTTEDVFKFAKNARENFETDDVKKKQTILATLGANFTIKSDQKLYFEPKNPYIILKNRVPEVRRLENACKPSFTTRFSNKQACVPHNLLEKWSG